MDEERDGNLPPKIARRKLRTLLRAAREAKSLTQADVAARTYWSSSKIIRLEQGAVPVAPTDADALCRLYEIAEPLASRIVNLAVQSRDRKIPAALRDAYTPTTSEMFEDEQAASVIYKHDPSWVTGLFQTEAYGRDVLRTLGFSDREITRKIEVRLLRQVIVDGPAAPTLAVILGEAALRRMPGSRENMVEQLERLLQLASLPNVTLQVLEFDAGGHRGVGRPFSIMQFDDDELPDRLYLQDGYQKDTSDENPELVDEFLSIFVELEAMATDPTHAEVVISRYLRRLTDGRPARADTWATTAEQHEP